MPSVKFSPGALCDMERLHDFLQTKNPIVSRKVAKTIVQSLKILEKHPQIGRPADDMDPVYRELVMSFGQSGYVALCRFDGENVIILAIRHQLEAGYWDLSPV
jgi:plasmid stabilization system protein ParE